MKMRKFLVAGLVLALLGSLTVAGTANALFFEGEETVVVSSTINDDVYVFGGSVNVNEDINGDLVIAGGMVEVNGDISGDLIAGGGNITVNGDVGDDLRIGGGNVYLNGDVGDELLFAGGTVSVSSDSVITGGTHAAGGNLILMGEFFGESVFAGGNVLFGGKFNGDVSIEAENLEVDESTSIAGNFSYKSYEEIEIPEGVVAGDVTYEELTAGVSVDKEIAKGIFGVFAFGYTAFKLWAYLSLLLLGLLVMLAVPYCFKETAEQTKKSPWKSLGYGAAFAIMTPVVAVILLISIIGVKVAAVTMMIYMLVWSFAKLFAGYFIGSLIIKGGRKMKFWPEFGKLAFGLIILMIVKIIPVVGALACVVVVFMAVGGLIMHKAETFKLLKKKHLV